MWLALAISISGLWYCRDSFINVSPGAITCTCGPAAAATGAPACIPGFAATALAIGAAGRGAAVLLATAARVAGALAYGALGGGSGELCTLLERCDAEPVTSCEGAGAVELNGSPSNRWMSELHATANTENEAIKAKRSTLSQRQGSATQRIGVPTHTQHTSGQLTACR
jgi:hypothetical protein